MLVGSKHVHTLLLISLRSLSHSSASLARVFLMADSSIFDGNRWPHWGQSCGLSTPTRIDLRGGLPDRLEPGCGCNSSARSINLCDIAGLILPCFYLPSRSRMATGACASSTPDKSGGLNGSMQHSSRTRLALRTKPKSLVRVKSAGTPPWLGFDRVQPNGSLLPGKHWRINVLDGVASTG